MSQQSSDSETPALRGLILESIETGRILLNYAILIKGPADPVNGLRGTTFKFLDLLRDIDHDSTRNAIAMDDISNPLSNCSQLAEEMNEIIHNFGKENPGLGGRFRDMNSIKLGHKAFSEKAKTFDKLVKILELIYNYAALQAQCATQASINEIKEEMQNTQRELQTYLRRMEEDLNRRDAKTRTAIQSDMRRLQACLEGLANAQKNPSHQRAQVIVDRNRADEDSRAIFGTDKEPVFHLSVSENTAGARAVVGAGAHTPETLQALLGGGSSSNGFNGFLEYLRLQTQHNGFAQFLASSQSFPPPMVHGLPEREDVSIRSLTASPDAVMISNRVTEEDKRRSTRNLPDMVAFASSR